MPQLSTTDLIAEYQRLERAGELTADERLLLRRAEKSIRPKAPAKAPVLTSEQRLRLAKAKAQALALRRRREQPDAPLPLPAAAGTSNGGTPARVTPPLERAVLSPTEQAFFQRIGQLRTAKDPTYNTLRRLDTLARAEYGLTDSRQVKELAELDIVLAARQLVNPTGAVGRDVPSMSPRTLQQLIDLYDKQVPLTLRTSQSVLLQQYSTPAPLAYAAAYFVRDSVRLRPAPYLINSGLSAFEWDALRRVQPLRIYEPTAGNGLLTVGFAPAECVVNEIDPLRLANLRTQPFLDVLDRDATLPLPEALRGSFDGVMANPPFGSLAVPQYFGEYAITSLEHAIALRALQAMRPDGRAAIIIGGHHQYDNRGRLQAGKNRIFFNYLYANYHVVDVLNLDGKRLYTRQGTGFPIRLILINGPKRVVGGHAPLHDPVRDALVGTFEQVWSRVLTASMVAPRPILPDKYYQQDFMKNFTQANDLGKLGDYRGGEAVTFRAGKLLIEGRIAYWEPKRDAYKVRFGRNWKMSAHVRSELLTRLPAAEDAALAGPYQTISEGFTALQTFVPDSMDTETRLALRRIRAAIGGDVGAFVQHRLGYGTREELTRALSAEQVDAVAMAVYNIEGRGQGMVIGDQTGIGKGRIAAALIRYGAHQGKQPIFLTEKPNLFSDLYRDLMAIGSGQLRPYIVNARDDKTNIKDAQGRLLHQALLPAEQKRVIDSGELPQGTDFVLATYSQFNTWFDVKDARNLKKKPAGLIKPNFLKELAENNVVVMDESHNASGTSNVGVFLRGLLSAAQGVTFLSATFAKRPDNMPIYAAKTVIAESGLAGEALTFAVTRGGVALQEILASQLVAEGQMLRRERTFEGVEVNWLPLDHYAQEHKALSDAMTAILRATIQYQLDYVEPAIAAEDAELAELSEQMGNRGGTKEMGISMPPAFSKVFNTIFQLLFSIKADAVADHAIARLREGKKVVLAFQSTMGGFLEGLEATGEDETGEHDDENETLGALADEGLSSKKLRPGNRVEAGFKEVLLKGLQNSMRYTKVNAQGNKEYGSYTPRQLGAGAVAEYQRIEEMIQDTVAGITLSPIDVVVQKIEAAGFRTAEVTGRKLRLDLSPDKRTGIVQTRKKENTADAFRRFNDNEVDCLLLNASGSTGASAHAIVTPQVAAQDVRQRVMVIFQPSLDINTEVQKRGRINRTGQIMKPIYDYVVSLIPAEMRLMMMLQKKLKSLDANTTSNQRQSKSVLDVQDFLNKYGDKLVAEYCAEFPDFHKRIGEPLAVSEEAEKAGRDAVQDAANKVAGRVAILPVRQQEEFYSEISRRYNDYVEFLQQTGQYDLEVRDLNLQATVKERTVAVVGGGGKSLFGRNAWLEKCLVNVLSKPFTRPELDMLLRESLAGQTPEQAKADRLHLLGAYLDAREGRQQAELAERHEKDRAAMELKVRAKAKKMEDLVAIARLENESRSSFESNVRDDQARQKKKQGESRDTLTRLFKTFTIGHAYYYPRPDTERHVDRADYVAAVFLGFVVDDKRPNPYAPSSLKLRFALASGEKYVAVPGSDLATLDRLYGALSRFDNYLAWQQQDLAGQWSQLIVESNADREARYLVTGNVLLALNDVQYHGKLVSYTTDAGLVQKGVLLPRKFEPKRDDKVSIPLSRARQVFTTLRAGTSFALGSSTSKGVSLGRPLGGYGFTLKVPGSTGEGKQYFGNPALLALVSGGSFQKWGGQKEMIAQFEDYRLDQVLDVLGGMGLAVQLTHDQIKLLPYLNLKEDAGSVQDVAELPFPPVPAPPATYYEQSRQPAPVTLDATTRLRLAQAKAKALALRRQREAQNPPQGRAAASLSGTGGARRPARHPRITFVS